jgi:hypothetical protein
VRRIDAVEVSQELSGKGDPVTLFVFTDSLEVDFLNRFAATCSLKSVSNVEIVCVCCTKYALSEVFMFTASNGLLLNRLIFELKREY